MDGMLHLYINEGTNSQPLFNTIQVVTLASGDTARVVTRSAPLVADLDGDGHRDLIMGQANGHASYFRSSGENPDPILANPVILQVGGNIGLDSGPFSRFAVWDWDHDGRLDLIGGAQDGRVRIFHQINPGPVQVPPYLELNFQGPSIVPDSGTVLNLTCYFTNQSPATLHTDVWLDLFCPDNRCLRSFYSTSYIMESNAFLARELRIEVPAWWGSGYYQGMIFTGDHNRLQITNSTSFDFVKVLGFIDCSPNTPSSSISTPQPALRATPNPFNPVVNLQYLLQSRSQVEISIYNSVGKKISDLINAIEEAGEHSIVWNATDKASGVYFVSLKTNTGKTIQKILYMK